LTDTACTAAAVCLYSAAHYKPTFVYMIIPTTPLKYEYVVWVGAGSRLPVNRKQHVLNITVIIKLCKVFTVC